MRGHKFVAAVDARMLVPVNDDAGGVVVYIGGRAAYYVMNGEWFAALPEPCEPVSADVTPPGAAAPGESESPTVDLDRLVSTS